MNRICDAPIKALEWRRVLYCAKSTTSLTRLHCNWRRFGMSVECGLAFVRDGFERFERSVILKIFFGLVTAEKSLFSWTP